MEQNAKIRFVCAWCVSAAAVAASLLSPAVRADAPSDAEAPAADAPYSEHPTDEQSLTDLTGLLGLHGSGLELSLWGWAYYAVSDQSDHEDSWGVELELDATHTIANRIAIAADVEFWDYDDHKKGDVEQAFVSGLVSPDTGLLLTVGKFNTPFGVEPRDHWDRLTATPSLLFRAQPQDMRAVMLTAPAGDSGLVFRPFAATGFDDEGHIAGRPSVGLMIEYRPTEKFTFAVTNWFGPGLKHGAAGDHDYGSGDDDDDDDEESHVYADHGSHDYGDDDDDHDYDHEDYSHDYGNYDSGYGNSVFQLTDSWSGPDFSSAERGELYFLDLQATWKPRRDLTIAGEFLFGTSTVDTTDTWHGLLVLAHYDIDDRWRAFTHWSFLDDSDGAVTGTDQRRHAIGIGAGYQINRYLELRTEYRHDFSDELEDVDSFSVHASFGY